MLKAAVIGVGSMGRNHARVYRETPGVELVGVLDANAGTAERVGASFSVPAFSQLDELLNQTKPDLVSLAVPTAKHFDVAMALLEKGIHVLVEKPITRTVDQGQQLVDSAAQKGLVLAVGHIERFNPVVVELRRRLREGMAGRIYQINAERLSPYPSRIADSGVVIDLASHDIDLLRYLTGEPVQRVFGETSQSINSDREDLFSGTVRFTNGVLGVLNVNWMTPQKVRRLTITAARGYFTCDLLSQQLFFYENETAPSQWDQLSVLHGVSEGNVLGIRIPRREPLAAELADFVQAVQNGREPTVPGREGLETLRVALSFLESAARAQVVRPELEPA